MMATRYGGGQREAGSRVMISRLPGLTAGAVAAAVFLILFPGALSAQGARDAGSPAAEPRAHARALKFSSEKNDVSPPLSSTEPRKAPKAGMREVPDRAKRAAPAVAPQLADPVIQSAPIGATMPGTLTNWAGIGVTNFAPPDTNLDV